MHQTLCLALASLLLCLGCDSGGDGESVGDGRASGCESRCVQKLTQCGESQADAAEYCEQSLCSTSPTEEQLRCAEQAACDALINGDPCGFNGSGGGGCPVLSGCSCGISGVVTIEDRCAQSCDEACAPFGG